MEKPEFPSNSFNNRGAKHMDLRPPTAPKKDIGRVTTGNVIKKKKGFLDKVSETFWGEDANTVANYLVYDVLLPAAKNTLFDMVKTGVEMLLWGEASSRRSSIGRSSPTSSVINYGSFHRSTERQTPIGRPRSRHDVAEVVLASRTDADDVLGTLLDAIEAFQIATVADYYQACGVASDYTDNHYGWTNLSGASVLRVREGYIIDLPRPLPVT